MTVNKAISAFLVVLLTIGAGFSQDKAKLEQEKQRLEKEIKKTKALIEETSQHIQQSVDQLEALKKQIGLREKTIKLISEEIALLENHIEETDDIILALENDLEALKKEYANMLYNVYKNRSAINQLIFIFSAKSFNDALKRMKYVQQYSEFRKRQAELIEETRQTLSRKRDEQESKKEEKQKLLGEEKGHQAELEKEKGKKDDLIAQLLKQEKGLKRDVRQKQEAAEKLAKKIEEIIKRELAAAKKREEVTSKLSEDFASNQGRLPWPVKEGSISSTFGTHDHPVLKNVKTINNGIDIRTKEATKVHSVFDGKVASVVYNPGFQRAVIVMHGEYFTVYSNLAEVFVRSGDHVKVNQPIGLAYTDTDVGKTEVHFEVWKGTQKLNPSLWIYPNNP